MLRGAGTAAYALPVDVVALEGEESRGAVEALGEGAVSGSDPLFPATAGQRGGGNDGDCDCDGSRSSGGGED